MCIWQIMCREDTFEETIPIMNYICITGTPVRCHVHYSFKCIIMISLRDKQVYEEIEMLSAIFVSYETKTGLLVTMKIISKVLFSTNMFG